jgi:hypothetical protein
MRRACHGACRTLGSAGLRTRRARPGRDPRRPQTRPRTTARTADSAGPARHGACSNAVLGLRRTRRAGPRRAIGRHGRLRRPRRPRSRRPAGSRSGRHVAQARLCDVALRHSPCNFYGQTQSARAVPPGFPPSTRHNQRLCLLPARRRSSSARFGEHGVIDRSAGVLCRDSAARGPTHPEASVGALGPPPPEADRAARRPTPCPGACTPIGSAPVARAAPGRGRPRT